MTMGETERSICSDLEALGDELNRMTFLLACAREARGIPEEQRRREDLVADCQMNTWVRAVWSEDTLHLYTDSESALVRGALSLIEEIYDGRSRREIGEYTGSLLNCAQFTGLFQPEQLRGLRQVLKALSAEGGREP